MAQKRPPLSVYLDTGLRGELDSVAAQATHGNASRLAIKFIRSGLRRWKLKHGESTKSRRSPAKAQMRQADRSSDRHIGHVAIQETTPILGGWPWGVDPSANPPVVVGTGCAGCVVIGG
jgi:hypothetical protein